jgi:replicative superfamily II helicase
LVNYIEKFCKERDYAIEIESNINSTENYSLIEAEKFISTLNLPHEVRDYQLKSFVHAIRNKRILLLSPTASGKSLIQYLILRMIQDMDHKKGLLIVPTTSLVEQMY